MPDDLITRLLDLACEVQQIPSPTFAEGAVAAFVRDRFVAEGLADVSVDDLGNVFARRPGGGRAAPVLVTAHTDTVFPAGTPLTLVRTADRITGPSIGDNSLGVAGLFGVLWALADEALPGDLWVAANVGEEGLGDLRGMRRVMDRLGGVVQATVVLEGMALGHIYHSAIAVRRLRVTAQAEGGHSWLHFGRASAIHSLMRLGAEIADLTVPFAPKTTYNIGNISGGTSINTIAREASFDLDLRSESLAALAALVARVQGLVAGCNTAEVRVAATVIGDRPGGAILREHPLVQATTRAMEAAGVTGYSFETGSTDANVPLSRGLACVCVGLTRGGHSHRPDEYIDTRDVERGLDAVTRVVRGAFATAAQSR